MIKCLVTKLCFVNGKRYRVGDTLSYDGDKLPSYLQSIEAEKKPKRKAAEKKD